MTEPPHPAPPVGDGAVAIEHRGDPEVSDLEADSERDEAATPSDDGPPPDGGAAWEFGGAVVVMLAVVGAVGGSKLVRMFETRPTPDQCKMLVERWLSHASRQQDPEVTDREVTQAQERARVAGEYAGDVGRCQADLTASEVQCGIDSTYLDALERCLQ